MSSNTTDVLAVKKCHHCSTSMYIHVVKDAEPIFIGCEPCIVDIKLEKVNDDEMIIKGNRSSRSIRCQQCKHRHLLRSFEEVKDDVSSSQRSS